MSDPWVPSLCPAPSEPRHSAPSGHPQPYRSHHSSGGQPPTWGPPPPQTPPQTPPHAQTLPPARSPKKPKKMTALEILESYINCFQTTLSTIPNAYLFVQENHPWKTGPDNIYLETARFLPDRLNAVMISGGSTPPDLGSAVSCIKSASLDLPTYAEMMKREEFSDHFPPEKPPLFDQPQKLMTDLKAYKEIIISVANAALSEYTPPSPSAFGTSRHWRIMQLKDNHAIYCHRPAYRRPLVPVKLKHRAFSVFFHLMSDAEPQTASVLEKFRVAANVLGERLNAALHQEATVDNYLGSIFREIIPETSVFKWSMQNRLNDNKAINDLIYGYEAMIGGVRVVIPIIMIEVKLLPGDHGDGYMQVCRAFDAFLLSAPAVSLFGAPCFAISISGSDLKVCGAFAESYPERVIAEVDLFEHATASCEISLGDGEHLAKVLFALASAVRYLSQACRGPPPLRNSNVPVVFETFLDEDGNPHPLAFGKPFDMRKCSIYYTTNPPDCMAKVTFRPYGSDVHNILYKHNFAPKLLGTSNIPALNAMATVMARLPSPTMDADGWVTLYDLFSAFPKLVRDNQNDIYKKLEQMVGVLKKFQVVHGDLRANNLMIKVTCGAVDIVKPVEVNAVDMEWSGKVKFAYYPAGRNEKVGYPGRAGGPIGSEDDMAMIKMWKQSINRHSDH